MSIYIHCTNGNAGFTICFFVSTVPAENDVMHRYTVSADVIHRSTGLLASHFSQTINIVRKSCRKHFWIVSIIICFPLRSDKVIIVLHCRVSRMWCHFSKVSRPFIWCARGTDKRHSEANLSVMLPVFVSTSEWQAKKCCNTRLLPLSAV
jgi:hypothetical protein